MRFLFVQEFDGIFDVTLFAFGFQFFDCVVDFCLNIIVFQGFVAKFLIMAANFDTKVA